MLHATFPHVMSPMMNEITLQTFKKFWVTGSSSSVHSLPYLTPEEHLLFKYLSEERIRLEQEHIQKSLQALAQ